MKTGRFAAILIMAFLLFGCIQPPGGSTPTSRPISDIIKEDVATPTALATVSPLPSVTATPTEVASASASTSANAVATPAPSATAVIETKNQEFTENTDDNGWSPDTIRVQAGVPVVIHLTEGTQNVYFAGASYKSGFTDPFVLKPGEKKDVTFTVFQSGCIGQYWPSSGVLKGNLHVDVQGQSDASR